MKRFLLLLPLLLFVGCVQNTELVARQLTIEAFKSDEVQTIRGRSHAFLVRKSDGSVWWVECNSQDGTIVTKAQIFSATKK